MCYAFTITIIIPAISRSSVQEETIMTENQWTEDSSAVYQSLSAIAVPNRPEQIATLLILLPFSQDDSFRAVELASGEGYLSAAILSAFPHATILALDGSEVMQQTTKQRLQSFGSHFNVEYFDMASSDWYPMIDDADCVLSSLCVHHLDSEQKQAMFKAVHDRLSEKGALLIADLMEAQHPATRRLFADTWDFSAEEQAGESNLFQLFKNENWNHYRYPDPYDKPSPLFHQLLWLQAAGFSDVDCFWMMAGHAIYGGYKSSAGKGDLTFGDALEIAENVLAD